MIILWSILSTIGLTFAIWYIYSVSQPRFNQPMFLWKATGHYISWALITIGVVSLVGLYISIHDSILFLKILTGILGVGILMKVIFTPLEMTFNDVMGSLYSGRGLKFGGFPTSEFLVTTEALENKQPGVRNKIIGEAHYLVSWLHRFPEITFFLGIVIFKSFWIALVLFVLACIFEIIRFYAFGPLPLLSHVCRFWDWIKLPGFIIVSTVLWSEGIFLSITLIVFLIVQGWLTLLTPVGLLPIKLIIARLIYKKYGGPWHDMEGLALNFVITRWHLKLIPADKFNID